MDILSLFDGTQNIDSTLPESIYNDQPQEETSGGAEEIPEARYRNLADKMDKTVLSKLSSFIGDAIEQDEQSRAQWLKSVEEVKKYLGFAPEDLDEGFLKYACRTFDTTLATGLIRFYATVRAELLPAEGPAGYSIMGESDEELEEIAEKRAAFMNYHLTIKDEAYYRDFERFLIYLGLYGSSFKKVYRDTFTGNVVSRFIAPQNFIVDSDCISILDAERLTHVLHLSVREIIANMDSGLYRKADLPYLKAAQSDSDIDDDLPSDVPISNDNIDLSAYSKRSLFPIEECHWYLDLDSFKEADSEREMKMPLPYIIVRDRLSKEILGIYENWNPNDPKKKRLNYFVQYNFLPGFGIYGIGLAHLVGTNAISLTQINRQLIDAGTFQNFPGGIRKKGMKQQNEMPMVSPGMFVEFDTNGESLDEVFKLFPYSGPSEGLQALKKDLVEQTRDLLSTAELGLNDTRDNMPVGTTLAILENSSKIQSAVLKSIHYSLTTELRLIDQFFKDSIVEEKFEFDGKSQVIKQQDFVDEVRITPVSDPSTNSMMHRIVKAENIMKVATQTPELFNMRAVVTKVLESLNLSRDDVETLLIPEVPEGEQQEGQAPPIDPNQLVMADIEQKNKESDIRLEIAQLKAEIDVFKAQLDFEKEKAKIASAEKIAAEKSETELVRQEQFDNTITY